jgi:hypothetical protein
VTAPAPERPRLRALLKAVALAVWAIVVAAVYGDVVVGLVIAGGVLAIAAVDALVSRLRRRSP